MILWLTIAVLVVAIIFDCIACKRNWQCEEIPFIIMFIAILALVGELGVMIPTRASARSQLSELQEKYETLTQRTDGVDEISYIGEIDVWNSTLDANRHKQHNRWIGIFYPQIYDKLDYIKLEDME